MASPLPMLAFRNLGRQPRRTAMTLGALAFGIAATVLARGLLHGVQVAMLAAVLEGGVGSLQVHRAGYLDNLLSPRLSLDLPADDAFLAKVKAVPGVQAVAPRIAFPGLATTGDLSVPVMALGLDPVREDAVCPRRRDGMADGAPLPHAGLALGPIARDTLGEKPTGLALLAPGPEGTLDAVPLEPEGSLKGSGVGEDRLVWLPISMAQQLLHMEGRATELVVSASPEADVDQLATAVRAALGPEYEVHTWQQIAVFLRDLRTRQDKVIGFLRLAFLVLTLLVVANTQLTAALERTREIGTMLAVGIRRTRIRALFLWEALFLGLMGAAVGVAVGGVAVLVLNAHGIHVTIPGLELQLVIRPEFEALQIAGVVVATVIGALLAGLWPAVRASRLRPVEALAGL